MSRNKGNFLCFAHNLINRHIFDPEQQLKVFDKNSVYLPTKKIGKNNPKAAEIEADNAARQEWNRTADMALLSGIVETKILEIKKEGIHQKASPSIKEKGWLPTLFRSIIGRAKYPFCFHNVDLFAFLTNGKI